MTPLLEQAFDEAGKRSPQEQDLIATRILAELAAENTFDQAIAGSADKLSRLAREAVDEHRGKTEELDPVNDQLPPWCNVYAGLSDEQIATLEQAISRRLDLNRSQG